MLGQALKRMTGWQSLLTTGITILHLLDHNFDRFNFVLFPHYRGFAKDGAGVGLSLKSRPVLFFLKQHIVYI